MSNETGVADTMHDLIVNLVGAVVVGLMGWAHSRSGRFSYVVDAARTFVRKNPRLFRGKNPAATADRAQSTQRPAAHADPDRNG